MMPPRAAPFRAEEMALVARLEHERFTDPRIGDLLSACEADASLAADERACANLREIRRDYERAQKLPTDLVTELTRTCSEALEAWREARRASDFPSFRPWLERVVALTVRKAECYGAPPGGELYDALLDEYEPGMTAVEVERIFGPLRAALTPFIAELVRSPRKPDSAPHQVKLPVSTQREFSHFVAERIGFDFSAGRLDVSTHPFTEGLAPGDTRITSRYAEDHVTDALGSTMHEAGHALYEQGLPKEALHGQPLAQAAGLGIHESQSRMWENQVGRSRAFWEWALPEAKRFFGALLAQFSVDQFYASVNRVAPSLIRVEADEATYNLHVMLRFDLERALVRGDLRVADLPGAWNRRIETDLGLAVPDDRRGCLQDIHWSSGAIGYFPTYTLGTLYAAQFWEAIRATIPDLDARMARGEFAALLAWLRENIHAHGRRHRAPELCRRLTGAPLGHAAMMRHLEGKLRPIYGI
jgi:carboxypeptidase Taq